MVGRPSAGLGSRNANGLATVLAMILAMILGMILWVGSASGAAPPSGAAPESHPAPGPEADGLGSDSIPFTLRLGARLQVRHLYDSGTERHTTSIRRARLSMSGTAYDDFSYLIQTGLAGGSARLLDAFVRYTLAPEAVIWAGQGKAPFGRQQLNSSASLHFVDRTVVDARFSAGRQQGLALMGELAGGRAEYGAGIYNGNGINQSENENDRFMTVGRFVLTPLGSYGPAESAQDYPSSPRVAVGVSGLRNTVGQAPDASSLRRINAEGAFKLRGLNMTAEAYREWAEPMGGDERVTDGWYYQLGYLFPGRRHELAGRYAAISSDVREVGGDIVESGVAYSYYLRGHPAKVQADLRNIRDRVLDADRFEFRLQLQLAM